MSAEIKSYQYLEKGPFKPNPGIGTTLLDAAATMTENYVEMAAEFTITDTKSGNTLWKDTVSTFIERMMTPEQSIPLIYEKLPRTFLWKSFGKPSRLDHMPL